MIDGSLMKPRRIETLVERAERVLHLTLPEIGSHDEAVNHLYYVDPNNDLTRLHSIAAAVYILRESGDARGLREEPR